MKASYSQQKKKAKSKRKTVKPWIGWEYWPRDRCRRWCGESEPEAELGRVEPFAREVVVVVGPTWNSIEKRTKIESHPIPSSFNFSCDRFFFSLSLCERINQPISLLNANQERRMKNISGATQTLLGLGWCFFFQTTLKPRDSSSTSTPQILVLTVLPSRIFYFCFCFCFSYFPEPSFA